MLDAQAKEFLDALGKREPNSALTPEENRTRAVQLQKLTGPSEPIAKVEDHVIPVVDGEIKLRIYTPDNEGTFPIFIYIHGGGWVFGDLDTVDAPCRSIANRGKCIVVSVDYRLAPEHTFPTPLDDCYEAVKWVVEHATEWQGDPQRISIGGDSAGGNLTAALTMKARDLEGPTFTSQVLIYPVTDVTFDTQSYHENGDGYFLTRDSMEWFVEQYIVKEADKLEPYAAPLRSEHLHGLPPALVITAGYDPLRDEGKAYAEKLQQAGVSTESICYDGMIHGFFWMAGIIDKGNDAIDQVAQNLQAVFTEKI